MASVDRYNTAFHSDFKAAAPPEKRELGREIRKSGSEITGGSFNSNGVSWCNVDQAATGAPASKSVRITEELQRAVEGVLTATTDDNKILALNHLYRVLSSEMSRANNDLSDRDIRRFGEALVARFYRQEERFGEHPKAAVVANAINFCREFIVLDKLKNAAKPGEPIATTKAITNAVDWIASSSDGEEDFNRLLAATLLLHKQERPDLVTKLLACCKSQGVEFPPQPEDNIKDLARRIYDPNANASREPSNAAIKLDALFNGDRPEGAPAGSPADLEASIELIESFRQKQPD